MFKTILSVIGGAAIVVGAITMIVYIYKVITIDASSRGLKHPRFWGIFATGGQNGSGLLLYFLGRKRYPIKILSVQDKERIEGYKRKIGAGIIFSAVGMIVEILVMMI